MSPQALSPDTEVVLLLCGHFGGERLAPFQPLSTREYDDLARCLMSAGLRPADLMSAAARDRLIGAGGAGLQPERLEFLLGRGTALALALERWSRGGLWVMSRGDVAFPRRLRRQLKLATSPLLYGAGPMELLDRGGLAIVGSREATDAALAFTREVATQCAREGVVVVSGGARGVDTTAMQGAIDAGGCAIGVVPNDLLKASLHRQHRLGLQEGRLVLVSPFHPDAAFNAGQAMERNKVIYALSDRALVIDSALRSGGTWAGAMEDLTHRWAPLYVRTPGEGAGNATLVQEGAAPFAWMPGGDEALLGYFERTAPAFGDTALGSRPARPLSVEPLAAMAQAPIPDGACPQRTESQDDRFDDFLGGLRRLLSSGPMSEDQIAERLTLEAGQLRLWLKQATHAGVIDRLENPVRYSIGAQASLFG